MLFVGKAGPIHARRATGGEPTPAAWLGAEIAAHCARLCLSTSIHCLATFMSCGCRFSACCCSRYVAPVAELVQLCLCQAPAGWFGAGCSRQVQAGELHACVAAAHTLGGPCRSWLSGPAREAAAKGSGVSGTGIPVVFAAGTAALVCWRCMQGCWRLAWAKYGCCVVVHSFLHLQFCSAKSWSRKYNPRVGSLLRPLPRACCPLQQRRGGN